MKRLLRLTKRIANKIFGTAADELFWRFRHLLNPKWPEGYINSLALNHPHRSLLIEKISKYYPFESVLEVGTAAGANLYLLSKKFPTAAFYGIDISRAAVKRGQEYFEKLNIKNMRLKQAKADNLSSFPSKSVDIIFTDAVLIYIGPEKIEKVLKEFFRVAKKALIFVEWHTENAPHLYQDHWAHNYKLLLKKFLMEKDINLTKIPKNIWPGNWEKHGYLIESKFS